MIRINSTKKGITFFEVEKDGIVFYLGMDAFLEDVIIKSNEL